MTEGTTPHFIEKILGSPRTRKGVAANSVIAGIALLLAQFSTISVLNDQANESFTVALIPTQYSVSITIWAAASLVATASNLVKRPYITPELKEPKCNFCGCAMSTETLVCQNCNSKSSK